MIKVESLVIKEFRGIRSLALNFGSKNYAICGPNGTGKSGVVDALEFVLTGNISRLSGEGKGDISLKKHGPHVDKRNNPEKARVKINVFIPSLNETAIIERALNAPTIMQVTPNKPEILEVLKKVEIHSEFVLSRRELIRYILATPGKRADEVQALLHLDQVEKVRFGLQKIANSCEKQLVQLNTDVAQAQSSLLRALGISDLTKENVLAAANAQRAILGLTTLIDLSETISLKDGIETQGPAQPQRLSRVQAQADIKATYKTLAEISSTLTSKQVEEVITDLTSLTQDPFVIESVKRETFYTIGVEIIDAESCPFCDMGWNLDSLKKHVQTKIDHLKEISRKRKAAEIKINPLITVIRNVQASIDTMVHYSTYLKPSLIMKGTIDYGANCKSISKKLSNILPLMDTITTLKNVPNVPQIVFTEISELEKAVANLPEPSKHDKARDWLTIAEERFQIWRDAKLKKKAADKRAQNARLVSNIYAATNDKVLTEIYKEVEKDFAALYRFANRDDENEFNAKLVPSLGKLGFDVDFYGRGFFPPGAYHSEGHQDSMGLCLYLALMKHLQGTGFTFAVLDDVLMSIDSGHRREVCTLLKTNFPGTQFIMTTHDPIWLLHMKTEGLIEGRAAVHFRNWNVEVGPAQWDERDVWTEIDEYLTNNDVRASAALLRHYLEYIAAEICHRLHAPVQFRGDAQYQLGELLPAATGYLKKLYGRAKNAANSWNQRDVLQKISDWEREFALLVDVSNVEQWQVNAAVHYNSWVNLNKDDFSPVVKAFKELLNGFKCSNCSSFLCVSPERESPESVRCECSEKTMNLKMKN
jgi:hypothetical protein